jgi:hypothetical protein
MLFLMWTLLKISALPIHSPKLLGFFLISSTLPRRRVTHVNKPLNHSNVLVDSIEDLVEVSLQEIPLPLGQIHPTPLDSIQHSNGEHSEFDSYDNMAHNGNQIPTWISQGDINLLGLMHEFPKCPERLL